MRKIYLLIINFLMIFQISNYAQDVRHQESIMSLGRQSSFYVEIDGADKKMTENAWKDFMKSYGKMNFNSKAKEFLASAITIPMISSSAKIDLYASIKEGKNQTTVFVWFDLGGGFANPNDNPSETKGVRDFMTNFYLFTKKRVIEEELKEEEKSLNKLQKDLEKLEDRNKGFHRDIEKAKEAIAKAEKNIEDNLKDQEKKKEEIQGKEKDVQKVVNRLNNLGKE